ncbi:unnamed protein product [Gulo gulo]|uniref:EF-hand domain-containing protein n=1 Tax=Gulo gulo TaxID=48420 RepID=A0A9X9PV07_GULGU|nr:unnamed protein product [Gulo gulo]
MCSPCLSKPRSRSSRKPSAASTRTVTASSASQTFGRPTPSSGRRGAGLGRRGGWPGPCPSRAPLLPGKVSVPEEELDAMLQEGKGPINFTVFLTLFGEKLNGTDPEEAILSAFRMFDPNGKGVVNKDEFKQLLLTQADKFSPAEVERMFALTPMDLAGDIDYKSLCYIITHGDEKEE